MTRRQLLETARKFPTAPGVYQMKTAAGELIYVGKAKNLRNRVSSYFQDSAQHSPRIQSMVEQVNHIDPIVTSTELEALILEANLIKLHRPKYNVLMKDDKKYPWLRLTEETYPRLEIIRDPHQEKGKGKYFGPYASPGALYQTLQLIKTIFPLRKRKNPLFKDRPCMNYHIGACLGPCQSLISPEEYAKIVHQLELFLKGDADDLLSSLEADMQAASEAMDFELAAQLRDRHQAVQRMLLRQRVMYDDPKVNQDVIGMVAAGITAYVAVLKVRRGKLINTLFYELNLQGEDLQEEAYQDFLFQYYEDLAPDEAWPSEVVIQFDIPDKAALGEYLSQKAGKKTVVHRPLKESPRKDILALAIKNAAASGERSRLEQEAKLKNDPAQALLVLKERLKLPQVPLRIECYDISHVSGTQTVASMVVLTDGSPDKKEYRRFKIQTVEEGKPDDFQSMYEVITRRFSNREEKGWSDPDLVIIDGGKGQLSSACKALKDLGITHQPIVSLAKKFEEIYLPGQSRPVILERDSMALFLVQKIRDEAHRFAITYHRKLRGKAQVKSSLDEVKGIGPERKKRLLESFKTVEAILNASLEEIAEATQTTGKTAEKIYAALHP